MEGRVALVTGGGQGIGRAIVLALANKGVIPVIADINGQNACKVSEQVQATGVEAMYITVDLAKVSAIEDMVAKVIDRFGQIDILVNNAGILHSTSIADITEQEWDYILGINLKSVFFITQQVYLHMKQRRFGRIINISSMAGRMGGYANGLAYTAAKAGVLGLTMGFARRVAEYNITVNAIAPGTTESDILKHFTHEQIEMLKNQIPLKRLGSPEKIGELVAFLASDHADFITGAVIDINGGMFMG